MKGHRDHLLGGRSVRGHTLHGSNDVDREILSSHMPLYDKEGNMTYGGSDEWNLWLDYAEEEGWSYEEAVDEWFSPEM